jgi:hypothetical protein
MPPPPRRSAAVASAGHADAGCVSVCVCPQIRWLAVNKCLCVRKLKKWMGAFGPLAPTGCRRRRPWGASRRASSPRPAAAACCASRPRGVARKARGNTWWAHSHPLEGGRELYLRGEDTAPPRVTPRAPAASHAYDHVGAAAHVCASDECFKRGRRGESCRVVVRSARAPPRRTRQRRRQHTSLPRRLHSCCASGRRRSESSPKVAQRAQAAPQVGAGERAAPVQARLRQRLRHGRACGCRRASSSRRRLGTPGRAARAGYARRRRRC